MRIFVTGATGFIGSAVVKDLLAAGHEVLGLTRSEEGARALAAAGAQVHHGDLQDLGSLTAGAAAAEAVIHLAFNHDFTRYLDNCEDDRRAIAALAEGLARSGGPMVVTSGTGMGRSAPGEPARETDQPVSAAQVPRAASEEAADAAVAQGLNVSVMRLPQVHDTRRQGLVSPMIDIARQKGFAAYVGDGANRWTAAHVSDVAPLYRLALERAEPRARYHAVAEEGIAMRDIAGAIGRRLDLPVKSLTPEEAPGYFGWLAAFAGHDVPASAALTRERLKWTPKGPTLIEDLERLELAVA